VTISTYAELQTAVGNWLARTDLTNRIPEFISIGDSRLNRKLRIREMHQLSTTAYTSASRFIELPANCLEIIDIQIKAADAADTLYEPLTFEAPELMYTRYGRTSENYGAGRPQYYTLRDEIEIDKPVGSGDTFTLRIHYLKKWNIASDSTNWLLSNYEDAYLYSALVQAEAFLKNDNRIMVWKSGLDEVMKELNLLSERSRDDSQLHVDNALIRRGGFNILNGDYYG